MSKVQTLLKVIEYRNINPGATDAEMASTVGITERYIRECKKDIQKLSFYLSKLPLERNEINLILSKLDPDVGHEVVILDKLQRAYLGEKSGLVRISCPQDSISNEYLEIGLWAPRTDRVHIDFWLKYLLYDSLLHANGDAIDYRLASACESIDGYSKWLIKLRNDVYWSDGKPITREDVINTLAGGRISTYIRTIKEAGKDEIILTLNSDDILFPYRITHVPIVPSQSHLYSVTNGPFLLRESKDPILFQLYRNKDYYRTGYPKIDWLTLKTYARSAFAVKAVMKKKLDLFPLRSLQQIYEWSSVSPQAFLAKGLNYHLLLINKRKGLTSDAGKAALFRRVIDYDCINLYLSGRLPQECLERNQHKNKKPQWLSDIKIGYLANMPNSLVKELALILARSLGIRNSNVIDISSHSLDSVRAEIDVILTQLYFGHGYCRLRGYFHTEGSGNFFGISYSEVDYHLEKLDGVGQIEERREIGLSVIQKLQDEDDIILLAPCYEYILSNLYMTPSPYINSLTDFIMNLPDVCVERGKSWMGV